jgi:tellurite resistance protein
VSTPLTALPTDGTAATGTSAAAGSGAQAAAGTMILGLFAIPLGVAGLGGVWQALRTTLGAPAWPAEALFGVSAGIWIALTAAYLVTGLRRPGRLTADAVVVCVAALLIVAAQLEARWLLGNLPVATFHPRVLSADRGWRFHLQHRAEPQRLAPRRGERVRHWRVLLAYRRHPDPRPPCTGAPLPDALKPSLAILVSPPATGGIAWFLITGGHLDAVEYVLLGILPFTTNFWGLRVSSRSVGQRGHPMAQRRRAAALAGLVLVPGGYCDRIRDHAGHRHRRALGATIGAPDAGSQRCRGPAWMR